MRAYLTAADVAARFGRSVGWFHRRRPSLEAAGFPRPVDGCGMRWDPAAIERWQDSALPAAAVPADQAAEATLIARARAMAAGPAA